MNTASYLNIEILNALEDDSKSTAEKLFAISKYFAPFLYNNYERDPSDEEKHEALIFACFWTLRIVMTTYKCEPGLEKQLFPLIFDDAEESMKVKVITSKEGLDVYTNRLDFYLQETKNMNLENVNHRPLLNKLYFSPLPSSSTASHYPDPIEFLKAMGIFSLGLKEYDELVRKAIASLQTFQ